MIQVRVQNFLSLKINSYRFESKNKVLFLKKLLTGFFITKISRTNFIEIYVK
jgi:hypothetical protein